MCTCFQIFNFTAYAVKQAAIILAACIVSRYYSKHRSRFWLRPRLLKAAIKKNFETAAVVRTMAALKKNALIQRPHLIYHCVKQYRKPEL